MEMMVIFYILLFLIAFFYASIGHGGASGYLALMALFNVAPEVMKPTALVLNLFVSLIAFIQFYRGEHFSWKLFLPLAILSIPMAFLGGLVTLDAEVYKKILGILLLLPVSRFFFIRTKEVRVIKRPQLAYLLLMGACIGLLSGLIGIGGGVILSPLLLWLGWADIKQTAAVSALFIFVNSLSGLGGQMTRGIYFSNEMIWFILVAFSGGLAGAWLGALRFPQYVLRSILATVLLVAVFKLIFTQA